MCRSTSAMPEDAVNHLTGANKDTDTNTPAYKDTAVRLEVLGEDGPNAAAAQQPPLATGHARRQGVEVGASGRGPTMFFPAAACRCSVTA